MVLPAIGFVVGLLLHEVIPGCRCDAGGGCHGCGAIGGLIEFLMFGGFVGALVALIFILPSSLVLAGLIKFFGRNASE